MISVVIPALNEERALPRTLQALFAQSGDFEAILVDGGSSDATLAVATRYDRLRVLTADTGRASQMNAGAAVAAGDLLLFLHADTVLPAGAIDELARLANARPNIWGGFQQQFSGGTRALRMVSGLHNWRCRQTGVFYGDQAMFVGRELFIEVGGFPASDVLEDIMLSELLRKRTSPAFLPLRVVTDSRKFEHMGPVRSLLQCLTILACYELRLPILSRAFFAPIR
jgi:rSAM/selenodomain-associated transferase 2